MTVENSLESNFTLTDKQLKHLDSIRWLFSNRMDERATGRSTILALVLIEKAIEKINIPIFVRGSEDSLLLKEIRSSQDQEDFLGKIHQIASSVLDMEEYELHISYPEGSFTVKRRKDG